ncbi:hypothetical protein GCM10022419_134130 [Nonomuraea rosea]|uniref:Uncharacterized protein n=1 Tax=Nonomuraea rosea TaxID=638574 RepID=A0ABP7A6I0_9ACTN
MLLDAFTVTQQHGGAVHLTTLAGAPARLIEITQLGEHLRPHTSTAIAPAAIMTAPDLPPPWVPPPQRVTATRAAGMRAFSGLRVGAQLMLTASGWSVWPGSCPVAAEVSGTSAPALKPSKSAPRPGGQTSCCSASRSRWR